MHELPVVTRILELALAATPPGARVLRVELAVGALCDAEPRWLERYFRLAARGTACAGAILAIARTPAAFSCASCGALFEPPARAGKLPARISCPACGSAECSLAGGADYRLERIEVAEPPKEG